MNPYTVTHGKALIEAEAEREGVSVAEFRQALQKAIDIGGSKSEGIVYEFKSRQGRKPTPEEFILAMSSLAQK